MEKIKKFYKNKKVLVTGATGFKGSWLCIWLLNLGAKVYATGYNPNKNKTLFNSLKLSKKTHLKIFDIRDFNKIDDLIKKTKPQIIFHLAAQPLVIDSYKKPYLTFDINFRGTLNILEAEKKYNFIKSVICVTSDKCYLNLDQTSSFKEQDILGGIDNYSSSKASAEIIFSSYFHSFFKKDNFLRLASARAGNVIGGGDMKSKRIIPDIIRAYNRNKNIILRNPKATRPWQHVLEPLSGYLLIGHKLIHKKLKRKLLPSWNFGPEIRN